MRDLSLHLIDIVQNSITAKAARIKIVISANKDNDELLMRIEDNGMGMDKELASRVSDPFVTTRTTRKVGLGIPLLKASAELAEGGLALSSEIGKGTTIEAWFKISSIDRIPLGDIAETVSDTIMANPNIELELILESGNGSFVFDTLNIKERLGGVPITEFEVIAWIKEYIKEGATNIFGGVLDEVIG